MGQIQELAAIQPRKSPFISLLEGALMGFDKGYREAPARQELAMRMQAQQIAMEQARQDRLREEEAQKQMKAEMAGQANSHAMGLMNNAAVKPSPVMAGAKVTYEQDEKGKYSKKTVIDGEASSQDQIYVDPTNGRSITIPKGAKLIPPGYALATVKANAVAQKETSAQDTAIEQADLMISKVDQALKKTSGWSTGIGGAIMKNVPASQAKNLSADLDTIKANLGFSTLAEMRRNSPTGGALGAISEREMQLLTAARASLEQAQSEDQVRQHLNEIKTHYSNWKAAVLKAREGGAGAAQAVAPKPMAGGGGKENADPLGIL